MKPTKKRLKLGKEIIRTLSTLELSRAHGGAIYTPGPTCITRCGPCTPTTGDITCHSVEQYCTISQTNCQLC